MIFSGNRDMGAGVGHDADMKTGMLESGDRGARILICNMGPSSLEPNYIELQPVHSGYALSMDM